MPPSRPSASATCCKALRSRSSLLPSAKSRAERDCHDRALVLVVHGHARREDCRREELSSAEIRTRDPLHPCKCATRLRHAPTGAPSIKDLSAQNLDELFELHAHLARELLRPGDVLACLLTLESVARTADREALS